jgi:O-antigen/teichoic acid export membrane protein
LEKNDMKHPPPDKRCKHIDEPLKEKLKKNATSNIAYFVLTFPVMFIITPMILRHVGKEAFGVWAIAGTVIAFLDFMGLQTPTALSVFIPKIDPKKNPEQINELLNTLFVFYMTVALIAAAAYFCFNNVLLLSVFKVKGKLLSDAGFVLTASIVLYLINFVFVAYAYVAVGFNIFYPANILHIIMGWTRVALMAGVLFFGYGIKGVAVVQAGSILAETLILNVWMKMIYPPLEFNPFLFKFNRLKQLLGLSIKLFVTKMASIVNYNIDKLVLGYLLNPVMVAYYQIGAGIAKYVSAVPEMIGTLSLVPAASELNAKNQHDKIFNLYFRINTYMYCMGVFITAGILAMGKSFVF